MEILQTHIHKLRFKIDNDAPPKYMERWEEFKYKCEHGENKNIIEQWIYNCKLESNKKLPYLDRYEGGIGGDNNNINKQIRFRIGRFGDEYPRLYDEDILMDQIINTNKEKWTYEELDDLICAFVKISNYYVQTDCVNGCIEMVNRNSLSDYYHH